MRCDVTTEVVDFIDNRPRVYMNEYGVRMQKYPSAIVSVHLTGKWRVKNIDERSNILFEVIYTHTKNENATRRVPVYKKQGFFHFIKAVLWLESPTLQIDYYYKKPYTARVKKMYKEFICEDDLTVTVTHDHVCEIQAEAWKQDSDYLEWIERIKPGNLLPVSNQCNDLTKLISES